MMSRRLSKPVKIILSVVVLVVFSSLGAYQLLPLPTVRVDYINVGSTGLVGDSILLTSSEGKVVLIDGGYPGTGALKLIQERGITHIDLVVLSHPHDDHAGGLVDVLKAVPVDRMAASGQTLDSNTYHELETAIRESGVKYQTVRAGDSLRFGRLTLQVLAPQAVIEAIGHNNNSVVLRLDVGKISFLFVGDAMHMEEESMLDAGVPLQATILKVGHHGDDTASSPVFLEAVKPEVAIYSAGKGNMHFLPKQVTLDNLLQVGAIIYGTDINGTITVTTDGNTYTVIPEHGGPISNAP